MNQNFSKGYTTQIWICIGLACAAALLLIGGLFINNECEDIANQFLFPLSYTLFALIPTYFAIDSVGKNWIKLKERVNSGLEDKTILLAGDKSECDNVEAQLHYSQLYKKKNITNISANRTAPEQAYNSDNFTKYDLVILCFTGTNYAPISDQQAELLSKTLSTIGHDEIVKDEIKANNSDAAVTGLIVLCPLGSLQDQDKKNELIPEKHKWDTNPFKRPFTAVVNQAGRLLTDVFSLLMTLPPRNGE